MRSIRRIIQSAFVLGWVLLASAAAQAQVPGVILLKSATASFNLLEIRPIDEFNGAGQLVDMLVETPACYSGDLALSVRALNSLFRMSNAWNTIYNFRASTPRYNETYDHVLVNFERTSGKVERGEFKIRGCHL